MTDEDNVLGQAVKVCPYIGRGRSDIVLVLHIMIKNFGKVESADIALNDLVVFVGNNNSGKTMVMQLIYGIREKLRNFPVTDTGVKKSDLNGQYLIRCAQDWFRAIEVQINDFLAEHKSRIIESIFGTSISVEEIRIALECTESAYFVSSVSECQSRETGEPRTEFNIDTRQYEHGENVKSYKCQILGRDGLEDGMKAALQVVWNIILSGKNSADAGQLFLPASRSGLQLLYKQYFAGEAGGNFVMPVKDFLRFLQLYAQEKQLDELRSELLEFGEEHLIQGKVVQEGDETFYFDRQVGKPVSLYIASSMIHELTPFIKALSAARRIDWLYCDEVENSLHPLLQREMARWLIRMVNAGIHVIVSSHSDTMASRLNNLFMLTYLNRKNANFELLSELGLKEADLLHSDMKAAVYEFSSGKKGKTAVEKLDFISHPLMGYDFKLFGCSLDKLYDEADKITR